MSKQDENAARSARLDELCKVKGPWTVEENQEFNRLAAKERFEKDWGSQR